MKKFYFGSIIYVSLFLFLNWYMFSDDRAADGPLSLGFPVPFYHGGGHCMGSCGPYFYWFPFILDVLFLILPILGIYFYQKKKKTLQ